MNEGFQLNYLDLILSLIFVLFIYKGYKKRFFKEFVSFLGLMIGLTLGLAAIPLTAGLIYRSSTLLFSVSIAVAFILIFAFVFVAFRFFERLIYKHAKFEMTEKLDRALGAILGLIKGAIIASLLAIFLTLVPISNIVTEQVQTSSFHATVEGMAPAIFDNLRKFIPGSQPFVVYLENTAEKARQIDIDERTIQLLIDLNSQKVDQWSNSKAKK